MNGKVGSLHKFISRATNKCLSFFKTLKMSFELTDECQKAFDDLKAYFASPLLLSPSKPNEELSLYLAISPPPAINSALIRKRITCNYLCSTLAEHLEWQEKGILPWKSWFLL